MLTPEQIEQRRQSVGASEAASVLGIGREAPLTVYRDKIGALHPDEALARKDYVRVGNYFEEGLIRFAADELLTEPGARSVQIHDRQTVFHDPDDLRVHATADAVVTVCGECESERVYVEAKSRGFPEGWGDPGTDEVPDAVLVQAIVGMRCSGTRRAVIPLLTRGHQLHLYELRYDSAVAEYIVAECHRWYERHVVAGVEPDPSIGPPPSLSSLRRVVRKAGLEVVVDGELLRRAYVARALRLASEKIEDEAVRRLIAAGLDAESFASSDDADTSATYLEHERKGYEVKATRYRKLHYRPSAALAETAELLGTMMQEVASGHPADPPALDADLVSRLLELREEEDHA